MLYIKETNNDLPPSFSRASMDELYSRYNRREFIHPDPLEFVYHYEHPRDREMVGLIASSLAYGRVAQILRSVAKVLDPLGASPSEYLRDASHQSLRRLYGDFKHRFTTGYEMASLLIGIKRILEDCGSLQECFLTAFKKEHSTILPALTAFAEDLSREFPGRSSTLLCSPGKGSACKRLNLFLRWMVRRDDVDPGVWTQVSPSVLIIPLDTHMHRISLGMGLTSRKQADIRTALEITRAFMFICPGDPVRYDFALTRQGIRRNFTTPPAEDLV